MKKFILGGIPLSLSFLFITALSFGQSTTILPSDVNINSFSNNNFKVESSHNFLGFSSIRFNPTLSAVKNPVLNGNNILTLGGGGYYNTTNDIHFSKARIAFTATENYSATASGSKMSFFTTPNGSITPAERMTINHDGNVGVGELVPTGKFQITHNTGNIGTYPHINLKTSDNASNGIIRMESAGGTRYFGQYFNLSSATPANNFVSFDYNGTTPILDMQGNGNVQVSGFTKLGSDAPRIKMKKLTGTTNAAQGGNVAITHGLDPAKIIAINVMVRYNGVAAEAWVGNGYTGATGYEFSYQHDGGSFIYITNTPGNSANILSKDIKIVVTYEE